MMLIITLQVDRPPGQAIGIKEQVAMALEHIGAVRVVSVTETHPELPLLRAAYQGGAAYGSDDAPQLDPVGQEMKGAMKGVNNGTNDN